MANGTSWSVSDTINNTSSYVKTVTGGISTLKGVTNSLITTPKEQLQANAAALVDATSSSVTAWLQEKLNRLQEAWTTTTDVTIGALVGEVAPYCVDFNSSGKALLSKLDDLVAYLLGTKSSSGEGTVWQNILEVLANSGMDLSSSIVNDPAVINAVTNLKSVQTVMTYITTISGIIADTAKLVKDFEPLISTLSILYKFANCYINPTSAGSALADMKQQLEESIIKLAATAMLKIKDYVFSLKISVPTLLVGALDTISVKEVYDSWSTNYSSSGVSTISANLNNTIYNICSNELSSSYFTEALSNVTWRNSLITALTTVEKWGTDPLSEVYSLYNENPTKWKTLLGSLFTQTLVSTYMSTAVAKAASSSSLYVTINDDNLITGYNEDSSTNQIIRHDVLAFDRSDNNIRSISKDILEKYQSKNDTSLMYGFIIDAFEADGCIVDRMNKTYDEAGTEAGGTSNRKMFNYYNNKIINYHKILKVLTGERRSNIYETIPVIDFLNYENTSLLYHYTDNNYNIIEKIPTTNLGDDTVTSLDYILREDPYTINRALMGYNMAEQFYCTTNMVPIDTNIQTAQWSGTEDDKAFNFKGVLRTKEIVDNGVSTTITYVSEESIYLYGIAYLSHFYYTVSGGSELSLSNLETTGILVVTPNTSKGLLGKIYQFNQNLEITTTIDNITSFTPLINSLYETIIIDPSTSWPSKYEKLLTSSSNRMSTYFSFIEEKYSKASGLLCGLFSEPVTRDTNNNVTKWKFIDETDDALNNGISIKVGTKYYDGYLLGRGEIKAAPLSTTVTPYIGKATEIFDKFSNIYSDIIQSTSISLNDWRNLQTYSTLQSITEKSDYSCEATTPYQALERTNNSSTSVVENGHYKSAVPYPSKLKSKSLSQIEELFPKWDNLITNSSYSDKYDITINSDLDSSILYYQYIRQNIWIFGIITKNSSGNHNCGSLNELFTNSNSICNVTYREHRNYKGKYKGTENWGSQVISPFDVFRNINDTTSHDVTDHIIDDPETVLFYPEYTDVFPNTVYLISKKDLGLQIYDENSSNPCMCSFIKDYTNTSVNNSSIISFKTTAIHKYLPSKFAKINLICQGRSHNIDIEADNLDRKNNYILSLQEDGGYSQSKAIELAERNTTEWKRYANDYYSFGSDCYIYKLEAFTLAITDVLDWNGNSLPSTIGNIYPLSYPNTFFNCSKIEDPNNSSNTILQLNKESRKDLDSLKGSLIICGLPIKANNVSYASIYNLDLNFGKQFRLYAFDNLFSNISLQSIAASATYDLLSQWPITIKYITESISIVNLSSGSSDTYISTTTPATGIIIGNVPANVLEINHYYYSRCITYYESEDSTNSLNDIIFKPADPYTGSITTSNPVNNIEYTLSYVIQNDSTITSSVSQVVLSSNIPTATTTLYAKQSFIIDLTTTLIPNTDLTLYDYLQNRGYNTNELKAQWCDENIDYVVTNGTLELPIPELGETSIGVCTLKSLPNIIDALIDITTGDTLDQLVEESITTSKGTIITKDDFNGLYSRVNGVSTDTRPSLLKMKGILDSCFVSNTTMTEQSAYLLDSILGNNTLSWLTIKPIDDTSTDVYDIDEDVLDSVVNYIKKSLDGGEDNTPVTYIAGDASVSGNIDSLYYKRYQFLNNRMNSQNGTASKAALLLKNTKYINNIENFNDVSIDTYKNFIEVLPVSSMVQLTYLQPGVSILSNLAEKGKFYHQDIADNLKNQLGNGCVLTCRTCVVASTCPFYNQSEIVRMYVPEATTIDLYVKDNELDLLDYNNMNITANTKGNYKETIDKNLLASYHKPYADIIKKDNESYSVRDLLETKDILENTFSDDFDSSKDDLGWLVNGRYGTVEINNATNLPNDSKYSFQTYKYLYNALFIKDEDTTINYKISDTQYDVNFTTNNKYYSGTTQIKIPSTLKLFDNAKSTDDVYLISDDISGTDDNGNSINLNPVIYLGTAKQVHYIFDLQETGKDDQATSSTDQNIYGKDVAQWCINYYKGISADNPIGKSADIDANKDQYWMKTIKKPITQPDGTITYVTLSGRPRESTSYSEIVSNINNMSTESIVSNKPFINSYINFTRRVSFDIGSIYDDNSSNSNKGIQWAKSGLADDILNAKIAITHMKTNLRLVLVHNS